MGSRLEIPAEVLLRGAGAVQLGGDYLKQVKGAKNVGDIFPSNKLVDNMGYRAGDNSDEDVGDIKKGINEYH